MPENPSSPQLVSPPTPPHDGSALEALLLRCVMPDRFGWNEGPQGHHALWNGEELTITQGFAPKRAAPKQTKARITNVHAISGLDEQTGAVGTNLHLIYPGGNTPLTPKTVPAGVARLIDQYLTVTLGPEANDTPPPHLTIHLIGDGTTLEFTPTGTPRDFVISWSDGRNKVLNLRLTADTATTLKTALAQIDRTGPLNTPGYLSTYAAVRTLMLERRRQTTTHGLRTSVHFTLQTTLLISDEASVRALRQTAALSQHAGTHQPPLSVPVVKVRQSGGPGHHGPGPGVVLETADGATFTLHPEGCLTLAELLPAWQRGEQHGLEFTEPGVPVLQHGVVRTTATLTTTVTFTLPGRPAAPLLINWNKDGTAFAERTWLELAPDLYGPLLRALFTYNRHTLTGRP